MAPHTRVQNWAAITLREADSFAAALELMNRGGYQLALVRRADGRLAGMVTDSDIRKALLRGITLEQPVAAVMNASPLVVSPELGEAEAHQLMLLNHFFHLPVVDARGQLAGLHVAEQLRSPEQRSETLVIMAGGVGNQHHLLAGLACPQIDAAATASLFNFVGDGLPRARAHLIENGNYMANW